MNKLGARLDKPPKLETMTKEKFMKIPGAKEGHWEDWLEFNKRVEEEHEYRKNFTEVDPEYWGFKSKDIRVFAAGDSNTYLIVQHIPTGFFIVDMESKSQIKGKINCLRQLMLMEHAIQSLKSQGLKLRGEGES